jgi:hypothetical protein
MDSINFSLDNEGAAFLKIESSHVDAGIFILGSPGLPIVCGRFGPKVQIWRYTIIVILRLSFKVNDANLLDPSITIICRFMAIRTWP